MFLGFTSSWVLDFVALGLWQYSTPWQELMGEEACHLIAVRKQKETGRDQVPVCPSGLTMTSHETLPPKGSTASQ